MFDELHGLYRDSLMRVFFNDQKLSAPLTLLSRASRTRRYPQVRASPRWSAPFRGDPKNVQSRAIYGSYTDVGWLIVRVSRRVLLSHSTMALYFGDRKHRVRFHNQADFWILLGRIRSSPAPSRKDPSTTARRETGVGTGPAKPAGRIAQGSVIRGSAHFDQLHSVY